MNFEKHMAVIDDLTALAQKHGIAIFISQSEEGRQSTRDEYDVMDIQLTDGTPSKKKIAGGGLGKAMHFPSATVHVLKNRYTAE